MKRNCTARRQAVSGFTLLEIVIVIGIISILLGVLIPTMRTYMTKSRLNTANSNAKVIFNSLQTIMQEYEFEERGEDTSLFYGSGKTGNIQFYCVNGNMQSALAQPAGGTLATLSNDDIGGIYLNANPRTIGSRMGRLYSDYETVTWCALIRDYSVAGVLCATSVSSPYIGGYPLQIRERRLEIDGTQLASTLPLAVSTSSISSTSPLGQYCEKAWGSAMTPLIRG